MKIFKLTYGLMATTMLSLASCNVNDLPEFDDSDAFVAFSSAAVSVGEADGSVEIPVILTSLKGLSANVAVEVVTEESTAVEGVDFTIETQNISFTAEANTAYVKINVVDNDEFTGNKTIKLKLGDTSVNLGAAKTCTVTIEDDEHPLLFILGSYNTSAVDYWGDSYSWSITVGRDDEDNNKVWISNLSPFFAANGFVAPDANYFYGFVNEEKTEIRVPVDQEVGYQTYVLAGFDDPDPDEGNVLETGSNMIIEIHDGGAKLVIPNAWGITGWYDLFYGGIEFHKK